MKINLFIDIEQLTSATLARPAIDRLEELLEQLGARVRRDRGARRLLDAAQEALADIRARAASVETALSECEDCISAEAA